MNIVGHLHKNIHHCTSFIFFLKCSYRAFEVSNQKMVFFLSLNHFFVIFYVWHDASSCWKIKFSPPTSKLYAKIWVSKIQMYTFRCIFFETVTWLVWSLTLADTAPQILTDPSLFWLDVSMWRFYSSTNRAIINV